MTQKPKVTNGTLFKGSASALDNSLFMARSAHASGMHMSGWWYALLRLDLAGDLTASASAHVGTNKDTAFRFAREGKVNVFYWIEGPFGYAISADADQAVLARVSGEVYRQLIAGR